MNTREMRFYLVSIPVAALDDIDVMTQYFVDHVEEAIEAKPGMIEKMDAKQLALDVRTIYDHAQTADGNSEGPRDRRRRPRPAAWCPPQRPFAARSPRDPPRGR